MNDQVDYIGSSLDDFDNNKPTGNSTYNTDDADDSRHRLRNRQPVDYKKTKYIEDNADDEEEQEASVSIDFDDSKVNQQPRRRSSRRNENGEESELKERDEEDEEEVVSRRTRRSNTKKTYFEESDLSEEDSEPPSNSRRKRKDDYEEEYQATSDSDFDDYEYNYSNKRRKKNYNGQSTRASRYKKHAALNNFIDDDDEAEESLDEDSLVDDLNDLADEQDQFESPKRHLRERSKVVDYKLPPPDSDINVFNKFNRDILETQGESPRKGRK